MSTCSVPKRHVNQTHAAATPPHPTDTNPLGTLVRLGVREADGREQFIYQPHTHTPIIKPRACRKRESDPPTESSESDRPCRREANCFEAKESHVSESPATGTTSTERSTSRRRSIHIRPCAQPHPHPPNQQQVGVIEKKTTSSAGEQRMPTSKEPTHRHAVEDACREHTTPPACRPTRHSQLPGVCNRFGAEVCGNGVDIRGPRRTGSTEALHPSLLGPTPHEENRRELEATESVWSRIKFICFAQRRLHADY